MKNFERLNKQKITLFAMTAAVVGFGFSMPGCPGPALEQQVNQLQTTTTELNKKVVHLTTLTTTLSSHITTIQQLIPQMTNTIQAQKAAIDQLNADIAELRSKKGGAVKKKKH
jgi:outer membrane murein-binding lipoprotein Lpp